MINLLDLYENASKQLGRQLSEDEINFLQWVYDRYSEEKQDSVKVYLSKSILIQE